MFVSGPGEPGGSKAWTGEGSKGQGSALDPPRAGPLEPNQAVMLIGPELPPPDDPEAALKGDPSRHVQ
jgi:hypothetical protein